MSLSRIFVCLLDALFQSLAASTIIFKQLGKRKFRDKIKFFIPMYIYLIICFLFIPNQFRFLLYITITSIIINFTLKVNDKKLLLYSFNSEVIVSISEIIVSIILVLFGISSVKIVNNDIYNLVANILISVLSIVIINTKFIYKLITKILILFDKDKQLIKYFYIFIAILYLIILKNGFEFLMKSNYYINILFVIGIVLILTIIIKNELKYDQINEQNKQMLNYVTKYENIIAAQGKANHEFKNQLMVIRGYAQMNSPKLMEYLDSIIEDSKKAGSSYLISQLNKFPDGGIKGLLYYKLSVMEDEKIKYEINVETGVKTKLNSLSINMYKNITKILGVFLDNAIDASKQTRKKKIIISVTKEKNNVIFKIYNTYKGRIDIDRIGTGYTTKGSGHGYGMRLVKDIVNDNKIFMIENLLEDIYYVSKLSIKVSNKRKK